MNKFFTIDVLGKVALGIALVGTGSLYVTRWAIQSKLRDSVSYKEALSCFRGNRNAVELLGEPVREKRIDIGDNANFGQKDNMCWVTVPLEGNKHKGNLNYWVTVTDFEAKKFHVSKVELEVAGSGMKILLMDKPNESPSDEHAIA